MDYLFFQESPEVELGGNRFIKVPTIIQWEDEPILQVGKYVEAGYSTKLRVFHSDGTHVATVNGSQVWLTDGGRKADVNMRSEDVGCLTVCELEGKTILEMRRKNAGQLKGWAELYAPEGVLIKATDRETAAMLGNGTALQIGGGSIRNGRFEGHEIGIHITKKDGIQFGGKGGKRMIFEFGGMTAMATGGGKVSFVPGIPEGNVHLHADPGHITYANTTMSDGSTFVRGSIGAPNQDTPPSGKKPK